MFNQFTRTFYDENEKDIYTISSQKPLRFISDKQNIQLSKKQFNVNIETDLREHPTRLNDHVNRCFLNNYTNPYDNLNLKIIDDENTLIKNTINNRYRYETDTINRMNTFHELSNKIDNDLRSKSSRNLYKNMVVCT